MVHSTAYVLVAMLLPLFSITWSLMTTSAPPMEPSLSERTRSNSCVPLASFVRSIAMSAARADPCSEVTVATTSDFDSPEPPLVTVTSLTYSPSGVSKSPEVSLRTMEAWLWFTLTGVQEPLAAFTPATITFRPSFHASYSYRSGDIVTSNWTVPFDSTLSTVKNLEKPSFVRVDIISPDVSVI